jgi:hypothetical protein
MSNGGIIGVINTPTTSVASGVWTLNEVLLARSQSIWPGQPVPTVDYLVIAGGGGGGAYIGGGGGAGGYREFTAEQLTTCDHLYRNCWRGWCWW